MKRVLVVALAWAAFQAGPSLSPAATVTFETGQAPSFSTTDSFQGLAATVVSGTARNFGDDDSSDAPGFTNRLTDATSASTPALGVYGINQPVTFQFDLGAEGAETRQLDSISLWAWNNNGFFNGMTLTLQASEDGVNFDDIASTAGNVGNSSSGTYNRLTATFAPDEVVAFRYLRVLDFPGDDENGGVRSSILFEIDGFTSTVPEPGILGLACPLAGLLLRRSRARRIA